VIRTAHPSTGPPGNCRPPAVLGPEPWRLARTAPRSGGRVRRMSPTSRTGSVAEIVADRVLVEALSSVPRWRLIGSPGEEGSTSTGDRVAEDPPRMRSSVYGVRPIVGERTRRRGAPSRCVDAGASSVEPRGEKSRGPRRHRCVSAAISPRIGSSRRAAGGRRDLLRDVGQQPFLLPGERPVGAERRLRGEAGLGPADGVAASPSAGRLPV
jgi:hypothetical protein